MVAQGVLPYQYESEAQASGLTALGGLPLYLDLAAVMGLRRAIQKHVKVREAGQGGTDDPVVLSLILLNLAGGDHVADLEFHRPLHGNRGVSQIRRWILVFKAPRHP